MVAWAHEARGDWKKMRERYTEYFQGHPISNAMEVFSGGLACFVLADGQPREAILYAVNFGRDTDCKAYTAGCFAGALRGITAVPADWVRTVEAAVLTDPYTVSQRSMREEADGLHQACLNELRRSQLADGELESMR